MADPHDNALRRDVSQLGKLLGEVIAEQEGPGLLELEERIRTLAIARRRGPREGRRDAMRELARLLKALPIKQAEPIIRAFAAYFQLVNIAEQHHRIRRMREHELTKDAPAQRGSLQAVLAQAKASGFSAEQVREAIRKLEVTLAFTAHPSQAGRRTVLEKLYRIAMRLEERDRCQLTPREQREATTRIREEVTALWQTDELRHERPSVGDEVKNVLWYVEEILWPQLSDLPERLGEAFEHAYGEPLGPTPSPLRLHAWPGGDMDGNPLVTPEVFEDAARAYHARGLRRLLAEVRQLAGALSQSVRHAVPPKALEASLAEDEKAMPDIAARHGPRSVGEPWRRKLSFVESRLEASLAQVDARRGGRPLQQAMAAGELSANAVARQGYRRPEELLADLTLVADTLAEAKGGKAGARRVRALAETVRVMGFHAAELELRTRADDARDAVAFLDGKAALTEGAGRLLDVLRRMAQLQREGGEASCRTLILSMARSAEDVLASIRCARAAGLWNAERGCATVDVVPLFEQLEDLDSSPRILRQLFAEPSYLSHVRCRGVQEVMVGYSDSGKEVGLLAASAALRRAQTEMPKVAAEAGVRLRIFHGRGESVARGGGPAQAAILALPRGAVNGAYKATEQGEAMDHKYARPQLAQRTLELIVGGALLHTLGGQPSPGEADEARYSEAFDVLAEAGRQAYRGLVWEEPRFVEFFSTASPLEEISRLNIGSRPAKRATGGLEALRAIPWVFAWTQNRAILPGWYGVGSALEAFAARPGGRELLAEMYERWPFFRAVLDNVEMVLAKTDLGVAARYARLAPKEARDAVWPRIRAEHIRTRRWLLDLSGRKQLLAGNPQLRRSISLRNPYVDPMSFLQVELLRRRRKGDTRCDRPLLLSVNGIAAGMRNTG
ncbi:MAG TPA: phosphoenolpyruvate carboxylase [Myxococcaceae bacterium]|nr:phosphoenolpyruvate carboxylase [Myxococcaceae bacterium]